MCQAKNVLFQLINCSTRHRKVAAAEVSEAFLMALYDIGGARMKDSPRFFFFQLLESVALADECFHSSARFRHRNVFVISVDHLPLGKL